MTTFEAGDITLQKVREYVWEIPKEGDMEVPARVFASEPLLKEIAEDRTLQQLRNAAHLPGAKGHAICMPDGHQGYGFPVGGVAGIDAEDGCISPGAVGYDINCLTKNAEVRLSFGRRLPIADLRDRFEDEQAVVAGEKLTTSAIRLFTESDGKKVYKIETETGQTLKATGDHPFETPQGMVDLEELTEGDTVFVNPFDGIRHKDPEQFTVLSEGDFDGEDRQLVSFLKHNDLLPLESTDSAFNRLLKLSGFHTGDGAFRGSQTWFYGDAEDLEQVRDDIESLGFTPSRIYNRGHEPEIDDNDHSRTGHSIKVDSRGFKQLLRRIGVPSGPKVESGYSLPEWFDRIADWQRALYLSTYFGAEMSAPSALSNTSLNCPAISQHRRDDVADGSEAFMRGIAGALGQLGIETNDIERFEAELEDTERLRLEIKNDSENLIKFFARVGYRYNQEKRRKSALAVQYLRKKVRAIESQSEIASDIEALTDGGVVVSESRDRFESNDRFIERKAWSSRAEDPNADFQPFKTFCEETEVRENLTVPVSIESIELAGTETVYDIGVEHDAHNFLANGIVVSNCGVRTLTTDLEYEDIRGREEELVEALFEAVPSGLGGGGVIEGRGDNLEAALERGVDWCLEEGYATESDLERCEDNGRRPDADPEAVSGKAKDRGRNQMGSLGSGNHFLEVQRVVDVFDPETADAYGLEANQVIVTIHCGSRGLGHQVCTDYLREIEQEHADLLAELPDKELAAAPAGSRLADEYYGAMCAAINFAWVNRQLITHRTRSVFADVLGEPHDSIELLYDVAHNIAKRETHEVFGEETDLYVHRKGATRAFPAGRPEVPVAYRDVGQPVIIPGSMGTGTYILCGGERSMEVSFGSTAHGAGRLMSRTRAKSKFRGDDVAAELRGREVYVKAQSGETIAEEAPGVYKDVDEVVAVSEALGIGTPVVRAEPICNIKG